jgi:ketosteroid isomerase-like protein
MSQENVETVRGGHDTFNRRDLDGYLALHDSDVEFTPYERAVEGLGPYRGHGSRRAERVAMSQENVEGIDPLVAAG